MSFTVERRSFLLGWLASLLAGFFGRSQAAAAPKPALPPAPPVAQGGLAFPCSITDPAGSAIITVYDASGNLISCSDSSGTTTSYTYDGTGQVFPRDDQPEG